ncbi:MAG: DegV family protein [Clostridia bacterium]
MIAIVTDSTAYLTREEALQLGAIIVPMTYSLNGTYWMNEGYIGADDEAERRVSEHMDAVHTSQSTLGAFLNTFSRLARAGYEILCVTMSSRLSGTNANAVLAAREFADHPIAVVDSLTTCGGLYLLIQRAREMIDEGSTLADVAQALQEMRSRVRTVFSVDDMAPLRRSGRLGNVKSSISTILNIKPLLCVNEGAIVSSGIARGRIDQMRKLKQSADGAKGVVLIERFLAGEAAEGIAAQFEAEGRATQSRRVGPVLGAHLGSGCIGLAWIDEQAEP